MPCKKQAEDGNTSDDGNMNELLKHAFKLVEKGQKEIKLLDEYKNVVLVLGGTGAGKSTFTQWIAGDDSKLTAKEVACGEFLIEDNDTISNSTIFSQTIFPELVIDTMHNAAFYDCPGFGDTRSTSYDLATTYLIKKVADYADRVKMIFVVKYPSVRKGVNREDFMRLMKHVTGLVKDIEKFKNSIALVITQVDNTTIKKGDNYTLVNDESIIAAIADFLLEVKHDLNEKLREQTCIETMYYRNAVKIIEILLTKIRETFTRLGLFRRPEQLITLDRSISHQNSKKNIQRMIFKTLDFTDKTMEDFGYGLSERSRNDINDIVEDINEKFWSSLKRIGFYVEEYFRALEKEVHEKIEGFVKFNENIDADPEEAKMISSKFRNGPLRIVELVKAIKGMRDLEQIVITIEDCISLLGTHVPKEIMSVMKDQGVYLSFVQTVSEKELNTRPWEEIFKDTLLFFKEHENGLKNHIDRTVEKINEEIKSVLDNLSKSIQEDYNKKITLIEVRGLLHAINEEKDIWLSKMKKIQALKSIEELVETLCDNKSALGINIPGKHRNSLEIIKKCIFYLEILSDRKISIPPSAFLLTLQDLIKCLQEFECWYKFLFDLYAKFSEYNIQKEKHLYDVENIDDWKKQGKKKGLKIKAENFDNFIAKIENYSIADCITVKKLKLTEMNLQELNHILRLTIKSKAIAKCTESTLTIEGDYISLKNIFGNESNEYVESKNGNLETLLASSKVKTIIFASNTIFIDRNLELVGRRLTVIIIAPKWEIIGTRKIDLRGSPGDKPSSVYSSKNDRSKANDGEPGKPGGAGGNFFGIGEKFINGENLSILVDGGKGGDGQKGQDGEDGKDGQSKTITTPPDPAAIVGTIIGGVVATPFLAAGNAIGTLLNPFGHKPIPPPTISGLGSTITIGQRGEKGQEGGDGGRGGEGGYPGKIKLFEINSSSGIIKSNKKGEPGEVGVGGRGGRSGKNASGLVGSGSSEQVPSGRDDPARDGRAGVNNVGFKPSVPGLEFKDFSSLINEYKKFVEQNLNDRFKKVDFQESFCEFLNNLKY